MSEKRIDFNKYVQFVDGVTSKESKCSESFMERLNALSVNDKVKIERLLTGAVGLSAESGELLEIVKKLIFQGKPWNDETVFHIKRELGDIVWYIMQVLMAIDCSLDEIVEMNIEKLVKRYPGGEFDAYYSENRKTNDL